MKKAVYRLILFAAITAFVLSLSPSVKAEPNDTEPNQQVCKAAPTSTACKADIQKPIPPEQPASDKETPPQKPEDEKSEANVYKDDVDNLKWAIKVIAGLVTAFVGFAFASMGVILFKNKKDYEHALADAKEAARDAKDAAKNARELEKESQGILANIGKQATAKLKEIDTKAKETMDAIKAEAKVGQAEIEEKGDEKIQTLLDEAERQRKISELFNKGRKTDEAKDHETAADCYRQIVEELKEENDPEAYYNWGTALTKLAINKKGTEAEELFKQAIEKYKKAIEIKQGFCEAYNNWGSVLYELAKSKKGKEAEKLFNQAIGKYKKAIEIKPDYYSAYKNLGNALLYLAQRKKGKDAKDLLKQTEENCLKAESIKTGEGAYNLACVYARRGNEDKCQEWLKVSEKAGTLTTREYAMADDDLKSVRDKDWFKKLRWKGE